MSKRYPNTYESSRSKAIFAGILDLMRAYDSVTPQEVAKELKISHASVGSYLKAMADRGLVVCVQRHFTAPGTNGGSEPSRWKIAEEGDEHAPSRACADERRVIVSAKWEPRKLPTMFEPMAYFFGRAA